MDSLRDRELGARSLHVLAECIGCPGRDAWIDEMPAVLAQPITIGGVGFMNIESDLKGLGRQFRQLNEPAELVRFLSVPLARVVHWAIRAAPAAHGGEAGPANGHRPFGKDYRRPQSTPLDAPGRYLAVGTADARADGVVVIVTGEALSELP